MQCAGCLKTKRVAYFESRRGLSFCRVCTQRLDLPSEFDWRLFLLATVPFEVGDRVEARTAAEIFDGVGTVEEVSMSLEHGGTPVYPTFRVVIDEPAYDQAPAEAWYTEVCLSKTKVGAE